MRNHAVTILFGLIALCCSGIPVVVLDDQDGSTYRQSFSKNDYSYDGTYQPCLDDAYKGQFVHDNAENKGLALATFSFVPKQDGCYVVEEYHPGGAESCSKYLTRAAKLEVGWCAGKSTTVSIDQSRNGGKWNIVGRWPFFKGWRGYFKLSNSEQDSCAMGNCFWVADAFRVTWTGAYCNGLWGPAAEFSSKEFSIVQATMNSIHANGDESKQNGSNEVGSVQEQGTISLKVTSTYDDWNLWLQFKNLGVLEEGLQAHLGYKSVKVVSIDINSDSQRRLAGCSARRLAEQPSIYSHRRIDVVFQGKDKVEANNDGKALSQRLQELFDAKDAGVQVKSAFVSMDTSSTEEPVDSEEPILPLAVLGIGVSALAFILVLYALYVRNVTKKTAVPECDAKDTNKVIVGKVIEESKKEDSMGSDCADYAAAKEIRESGGTFADVVAHLQHASTVEDSKKEVKDEEDILSVSTATPPSDADAQSVLSETSSTTQKSIDGQTSDNLETSPPRSKRSSSSKRSSAPALNLETTPPRSKRSSSSKRSSAPAVLSALSPNRKSSQTTQPRVIETE